MDSMEMMQLANEDQEAFMHRMRDAFIDQGVAVEAWVERAWGKGVLE